MADINSAKYYNKTASGLVVTGPGQIYGVIINSNTSGTMKLWDSLTATGNVIVNTFTFPAGSSVQFFPTAVQFYTGLFYTLGGTADVTLVAMPDNN